MNNVNYFMVNEEEFIELIKAYYNVNKATLRINKYKSYEDDFDIIYKYYYYITLYSKIKIRGKEIEIRKELKYDSDNIKDLFMLLFGKNYDLIYVHYNKNEFEILYKEKEMEMKLQL